jgi:hypothetical protein
MSDTPLTGAVSKQIGSLAAEWVCGKIYAADFALAAQVELNKLGTIERELAEARADAVRAHQMACAARLECDEARKDSARLEAALTEAKAIVKDQITRHVAMTSDHRDWLIGDICMRIDAAMKESAK